MTGDAIFRIASMTKPVTSLLVMMFREEGKLKLTDPISRWFPQFSSMKVKTGKPGEFENASRPITVFDLLTHTSGITYKGFLGGDIDSPLTNQEWISALADVPLASHPGDLFHYGRSTDLLGMLISTIEETSLENVMKEKIFDRLGMTDTFFNLPEHKKSRCALNVGYDESGNLVHPEIVPSGMAFKERPTNLEFQSGGQGLWSTADDYLEFAKLFVQDKNGNERSIVKPETIEMMCRNHLTPAQREKSKLLGAAIFREHYGFGLGVAVALTTSAYGSIPCSASIQSVGWPGAYGGWWSADPVNKSVAIFLTHCMTEPAQLSQGIGLEVYDAMDIFSKFSRLETGLKMSAG
jgi:CubicO group peptidase (beta-lactamase class C family)